VSKRAPKLTRRLNPGAGPKYVKIYELLKYDIEQGRLPNARYLPPENRMAEEFGVSLGTVKKALAMLKAENYVQRRKGDGTWVSYTRASARDSRAIVVLMGDIAQSFHGEIYRGVQQVLSERGYKPILIDTRSSAERERECLVEYGPQVGGLLVVPADSNNNHAAYGSLLSDRTPFVFMDRFLRELNVDAVVADNVKGGYLATKHLLELGHRRIAVTGVRGSTSIMDRVEGYRSALAEFGVPFDEGLLSRAKETGYLAGYELAETAIAARPDVTAAFCLRDDAAWGCMQRLSELGVSVPGDVSLVGYDDNRDICDRLRPTLTTVRQPRAEVGSKAAEMLIARLERRTQDAPAVTKLPVEFVLRESTAKPRKSARKSARKRARGKHAPSR